MTYRLAIFDFDGTLADSFPFFLRVFNTVARAHGFREIDVNDTAAYRGCDARQMMRHLGLPAWKLPAVARHFTSLMQAHIGEVQPFAGIAPVLRHLHERGLRLALVSSNTEANVRAVLGPECIARFDHLECGMSIFGKASRIAKVLRRTGAVAAETICIGDQITDLEAAHHAGTAFGAVGWGYGTLASLRARGPEMAFEQVADLRQLA